MTAEELIIFFEIILIDLVLAGDNAIIIGMVASQFKDDLRKKIIFWGIGAAVILRIAFTLIATYLLQINGLKLIGEFLDKSILKPNNISHPKSRIEFMNTIKD